MLFRCKQPTERQPLVPIAQFFSVSGRWDASRDLLDFDLPIGAQFALQKFLLFVL